MRNLQQVALESGLGKCSNCGQHLSTENITNALLDLGVNPNEEETREKVAEVEKITLCCPTYSEETGCKGYSSEDKELAAYWSTH